MNEKELGDVIFLILMSIAMLILFWLPLTLEAIKEIKSIKKERKRRKEV